MHSASPTFTGFLGVQCTVAKNIGRDGMCCGQGVLGLPLLAFLRAITVMIVDESWCVCTEEVSDSRNFRV